MAKSWRNGGLFEVLDSRLDGSFDDLMHKDLVSQNNLKLFKQAPSLVFYHSVVMVGVVTYYLGVSLCVV